MKNLTKITMVASIIGMTGCTTTPQYGKDSIEDVIAQMTIEEKAQFVVGTNRLKETPPDSPESIKRYPQYDKSVLDKLKAEGKEGWEATEAAIATLQTKGRVQGAAGQHFDIPRLGIPAFVYADGPAGVRIDPKRDGDDGEYYCTAFPTETALCATWDTELVERTTTAMGEEAKEYGVDVLLAPAINIHRNPLCGRNFEYFSEDPLLVGKMATAYINGVQKNDVGVSLKHFAVNNQETHRNGVNAKLSMRALREIYLRGFEIAVRESQPWTIMSSYNKINGVFASENKWLLNDILRGDFEAPFQGFVMTDWWAQENGARQQLAGNDLIMPGTQRQLDEVIEAQKDGTLPEEVINKNIYRILKTMEKSTAATGYKYSNKPDLAAHAKITREVACEGMVLLKNDNAALPMQKSANVALFGNSCYDILVGGSGSGNVNRKYKVSLLDGMKGAGFAVDAAVADAYAKHLDAEKAKVPAENFWIIPVFAELKLTEQQVAAAMEKADYAVVSICRMAGEGGDRKAVAGDYFLSDVEKANVELVCRVAHKAGKKAIVLLNMGNIIDLNAVLAANPDAILHSWLGGQEAGNSIADVLSGAVNPSGKLPMTWAKRYEDYASSKNFPFTEGDSVTVYAEDIYVGYRQFDKGGAKPLYPFGFGLSYTTFAYSDLQVQQTSDAAAFIKAKVTVKNTGAVAGREVVQLYQSSPAANMPVKELKAFGKTKLLQPGESQTIELTVRKTDLSSWSETANKWTLDAGEYTYSVAANAEDVRLSKKVQIQ